MTITLTDELTVIVCTGCGIRYAVPENWRQEKQSNGDGFHCPNGCRRAYCETDAQKYRKLWETEQRRLIQERQAHDQTKARAREAEESAENQKRAAKRLRTRAANGVCPCCKRSFASLAAHMKSKHPEYATPGA